MQFDFIVDQLIQLAITLLINATGLTKVALKGLNYKNKYSMLNEIDYWKGTQD